MEVDFQAIRDSKACPFCQEPKDVGLVTHWGRCYRESGFKDGDPAAAEVVEAFNLYLQALQAWKQVRMWKSVRN